MRSLIVITSLALIIIYSLFSVPTLAANTYPYPTATTCAVSCQADPWGFYKRECTSYAAWKANEMGVGFTNGMTGPNGSSGWFGNAGNWDNNASVIGFSVNTTPAAGKIAVWEPFEGGALGAGHVAYVESVNGSTVNISEYNWNPAYSYNTRSFTNGVFPSASKYISLGSSGLNCPSGANINLTTVINNGVTFSCSASNSITLKPGFHAKTGSTVNLYIQ